MDARLFLTEGDRTCDGCGGIGSTEGEGLYGGTRNDECDECDGTGRIGEENNPTTIDAARQYRAEEEERRWHAFREAMKSNSFEWRGVWYARRAAPMQFVTQIQSGPAILLPDAPIGITATIARIEFLNAPDEDTFFGLALANARTQAKGWVL